MDPISSFIGSANAFAAFLNPITYPINAAIGQTFIAQPVINSLLFANSFGGSVYDSLNILSLIQSGQF